MKLNFLFFAFLFLFIQSCGDSPDIIIPENDTYMDENAYIPTSAEVKFEKLMENIDLNDSLRYGQSLSYNRPDGASVFVKIYVNDSNYTVKLFEEYTSPNSPSIQSNTFYFDKGILIATRELFEEGTGDEGHFVERVTYYDEKEKPILTKRKVAAYEEELIYEPFTVAEKVECSYKRAMKVINQEGEYETNFIEFIPEDPYLYLIVGENKKDGYYSSLVVQMMTSLIKKLQSDPEKHFGTPLNVTYEILNGEQGYEYQILMGVNEK